jgi:hypothetical protein
MSWLVQQLNEPGGLTAGPAARAKTLFCAAYGTQLHASYVDGSSQLWDVYGDATTGAWNAQRLTGSGALTVGPPPALGAPFLCNFAGQLHATYVAASGALWDAWYDPNARAWRVQQLTGSGGLTGAPPAATGPSVLAFGAEFHVLYTDSSGTVQDVVYSAFRGSWSAQSLTGTAGLTAGPPSASFVSSTTLAPDLHVFYVDGNGSIQNIHYQSASKIWSLQQLTGPSGATSGPAAVPNTLCAATFDAQFHCCYVDGSGIVRDVWKDQSARVWQFQTLAGGGGLTNGPAAASGVCATTYAQQFHVSYLDAASIVWDAWYDAPTARWNLQRLVGPGGMTNGPSPTGGPPSLVTVGAEFHMSYLDAGAVWDLEWTPG